METPIINMTHMPHKGHEEHLCFLNNLGLFDRIKDRVREPAFICRKCGRAASKASFLCEPEKL